MREQRPDLFQRIAFRSRIVAAVRLKVVRRPSCHFESGNDPARRFLQIMAGQIEFCRAAIGPLTKLRQDPLENTNFAAWRHLHSSQLRPADACAMSGPIQETRTAFI